MYSTESVFKMKSLIKFVVFLALSTPSIVNANDLTFKSIQNPCDDIRNGQFICKDCETAGYCVQQNGGWHMMPVGVCNTAMGMFCDEDARGCIFQTSCKLLSRGPKFECQNPGIFPDPYECKYYHVCDNNNQDNRMICPSGTAYSPATQTCSLSANNVICTEQQFKCTQIGQMGSWPTDPSIGYVCAMHPTMGVLYPLLYKCQNGSEFVNGRCILVTNPTPTPSTGINCNLSSGLMENPNNCTTYYQCVNGKYTLSECKTGTYFNSNTHSCVIGNC